MSLTSDRSSRRDAVLPACASAVQMSRSSVSAVPMPAFSASGSAADSTSSHSPESSVRRHRASVPCRDSPDWAASFCSSWVFLLRMHPSSRCRVPSGAPTASSSPVTKPMWESSTTLSAPVIASESMARETTCTISAQSTAPMHSSPIWLISLKVWLSRLGR